MYDTILNNKIQRIGQITDALASGEEMPGWKRDDLIREFWQLNTEIAPDAPDPARQSVSLRSWWAYFATSEMGKMVGRRVLVLYVIILISVVFTVIGYAMMGFGDSR